MQQRPTLPTKDECFALLRSPDLIPTIKALSDAFEADGCEAEAARIAANFYVSYPHDLRDFGLGDPPRGKVLEYALARAYLRDLVAAQSAATQVREAA